MGVGVDDLQGSLPVLTILWLCDDQDVGNEGQKRKTILIKKKQYQNGETIPKDYLPPRNKMFPMDIFALRFFKSLDVDWNSVLWFFDF